VNSSGKSYFELIRRPGVLGNITYDSLDNFQTLKGQHARIMPSMSHASTIYVVSGYSKRRQLVELMRLSFYH